MQKLTDLEYSMLMQAIQNALQDDEFVDPYEAEYNITNEQAREALLSGEAKLQAQFLK